MKRRGTVDAEEVEKWMKNPRVACRVIPGTDPPALVDIFKGIPRGNFTFFLSHFHSDHYGGLSKNWTRGIVHCSTVTGRMLSRSLGVGPSYVKHLELDTEYDIGGATVTLVDANHCPGAAMLLFRTRDGRVYLHTGDFRFDPQMLHRPILRQRKIDILYLDTTYAHPDYAFVSQSESLRQAVDISKKRLVPGIPARTLYLVGAYATGKEKVAFALAEAHGCRIYASGKRRCLLDCQDLTAARRALITDNAAEASVHLVPMSTIGSVLPYFRPNFTRIQSYLQENKLIDIFSHVVGLLPTGWSLSTKWNKEHAVATSGSAAVHLLEYSEHSSYPELRAFVLGLNPALVVPTVFSGTKNYETLLEDWQPSKLGAQVALEKAQQQSTKRKRDGEAVVEDKAQRRITAFFRHKTSVGVATSVSTVEGWPENVRGATSESAGGSCRVIKTAAAAAVTHPVAVGDSPSVAEKASSQKASAARENIVDSAPATPAAATAVVRANDLALKTAACVRKAAEKTTADEAAAAVGKPSMGIVNSFANAGVARRADSAEFVVLSAATDNSISVDAGRRKGSVTHNSVSLGVKEESITFMADCVASDSTLRGKLTKGSDVKETVNTSVFHVDSSSTRSSDNSGSSSYGESKTGEISSRKLEQTAGSAVSVSGVRANRKNNFSKAFSVGADSRSLTAGRSPRTPQSRGAAIKEATTAAASHTDSGSNCRNRLTLPLAWIKKKAAATTVAESCTDRSSNKTGENVRLKEQHKLNSFLGLASYARIAKGESPEKYRKATFTEEEVIEISDG